ncbi:hypothetical protein K443DRAFT_681199 [Laccaria amethystina LaAM-08-1]|uniref:Uncharacterized protein n=1 Tax=Laccaria amethystina LaAM-08-1 TaxID=1095629 RepID=A0A0C9X952_9AGAR|nr:hypothetical protein K443DRAFT_681199 [Laccaria amethystina LaAM-08-1]
MLALRPTDPARPPDMLQCRGRSRQVSHTALARQASEERCYAVGAIHHSLLTRSTPERNNSQQPCLTDEKRTISPFTHPPPPPYTDNLPTVNNSPPVPEPEVMPIAAPVPVRAAFTPHFIHSESPSPPSSASMSPDYYDSPPSPPRSLEDQVHVAYAHDDIHLAKILLLRLKGIEVTSDDDPRIAEVRDEDFDFCFVPNGGLMLDERDEKWMMERQREERERLDQKRRLERLKACEQIWVDVKRRLREERVMVLRRREMSRIREEERRRKREEEQRRWAEEERKRERAEVERAAERANARVRARAERKVVSYHFLQPSDDSSSSSEQRSSPFVYNFMVSTSSRTIKTLISCSPPKPIPQTRPHFQTPSFDDSRCIPFTDVLKSMQGPLFPLSREERMQCNGSPARSRSSTRSRREVELLQSLLSNVECKRGERSKQQVKLRRPVSACAACSAFGSLPSPALPSSPTSSAGSLPRSSSWLSFRSSSSSPTSSASTIVTTPSTSPATSAKASWFITTTVPSFASRRPKATSVTIPAPEPVHSCHSHSHLTPIAPSEGPLSIAPPSSERKAYFATREHEGASRGAREARSSPTRKECSSGVVVRRMSQLVELARGLQSAYMTATLFSPYESFEEPRIGFGAVAMSKVVHDGGEGEQQQREMKKRLAPAGYRVCAGDVAAFLSPARSAFPASSSGDTLPLLGTHQEPEEGELDREDDVFYTLMPRYIPLNSSSSPSPSSSSLSPRTVLPNPLPYPLVFKPIPAPSRSPFSMHLHTTFPSSASVFRNGSTGVVIRERAVGNPMYLRLKALHNIVWTRGVLWEGRARETSLGGGRERVLGVACEGVGRSALPVSLVCRG